MEDRNQLQEVWRALSAATAGKPVQEDVEEFFLDHGNLRGHDVKSAEDLAFVAMEDGRAIKECGGHTFVTMVEEEQIQKSRRIWHIDGMNCA
jgi:hypothetical protein